MSSRALLSAALLLFASLGACTSSREVRSARGSIEAGHLETARSVMERERRKHPRSVEVRVTLGEVYYRLARDSLDRGGDEAAYLANLERSVNEFLAAAALDPESYQPHFYLAVVDVYRGDLDGALRGFRNCRRLDPAGVSYTNIAETLVYRGELEQARRWNRLGERRGADPGIVIFNEMLISWRAGDLRRARRLFERLRILHPEHLRTVNMARLPQEPRSFEEFAAYCCGSPACGPYLADACRRDGLAVRNRAISDETLLQELRIEMEKRRRLNEIYEQRKDLEIEIEEPEVP